MLYKLIQTIGYQPNRWHHGNSWDSYYLAPESTVNLDRQPWSLILSPTLTTSFSCSRRDSTHIILRLSWEAWTVRSKSLVSSWSWISGIILVRPTSVVLHQQLFHNIVQHRHTKHGIPHRLHQHFVSCLPLPLMSQSHFWSSTLCQQLLHEVRRHALT